MLNIGDTVRLNALVQPGWIYPIDIPTVDEDYTVRKTGDDVIFLEEISNRPALFSDGRFEEPGFPAELFDRV